MELCYCLGDKMGEMDFDNFDAPANLDVTPLGQPAELPEIKLFGRWSCDDVQVNDMSLQVNKIA